jgi:chromate transporter
MRELLALIVLFVPLSLLSFGGGASILAPIHDATVVTHQWLSARDFIDYFAISRASPGPGSMMVTLVGWKVAGWPGAIIATASMFLPSSLLCYRLAKLWNGLRGTALHTALERGLMPIGTGLMMAGAILVLRTSEAGLLGWLVAALSTALVIWRNVYPLIVLALGGALFVITSAALRML